MQIRLQLLFQIYDEGVFSEEHSIVTLNVRSGKPQRFAALRARTHLRGHVKFRCRVPYLYTQVHTQEFLFVVFLWKQSTLDGHFVLHLKSARAFSLAWCNEQVPARPPSCVCHSIPLEHTMSSKSTFMTIDVHHT